MCPSYFSFSSKTRLKLWGPSGLISCVHIQWKTLQECMMVLPFCACGRAVISITLPWKSGFFHVWAENETWNWDTQDNHLWYSIPTQYDDSECSVLQLQPFWKKTGYWIFFSHQIFLNLHSSSGHSTHKSWISRNSEGLNSFTFCSNFKNIIAYILISPCLWRRKDSLACWYLMETTQTVEDHD